MFKYVGLKIVIIGKWQQNMAFLQIFPKGVATKSLYIEAEVKGFKNEHAVL